ncbi:DivIVA domain-containing protein [Nocardioides alkalitolerans]|uniref:DivIVA domain-containing protein n=1 Tax=Nocardioides alkalitolerans TaxID=281714 RepID=UPI00041A3A5B|nr:DivIVA domain-containing protein [Nocardioides alkalitolerans]
MMWVFALLAVAAMAGVAAVAAGHGDPLRDEYVDRPDTTVPAAGPVTADDLRRLRFPVVLRGYRMSEVDALVERLVRERDVDLYRPTTEAVPDPDPAPDRDDAPAEAGDGPDGDAHRS